MKYKQDSQKQFITQFVLQSWKENPVITSVAQIPIESIFFQPVTICPIEETKDEAAEELADWAIEDLVKICNFTKNTFDTGLVCNTIQVRKSNKIINNFDNIYTVRKYSMKMGPVLPSTMLTPM